MCVPHLVYLVARFLLLTHAQGASNRNSSVGCTKTAKVPPHTSSECNGRNATAVC